MPAKSRSTVRSAKKLNHPVKTTRTKLDKYFISRSVPKFESPKPTPKGRAKYYTKAKLGLKKKG